MTRHPHLPLILALALAPLPALAQDRDDPRADARMHAGPFYFTPRVLLKDLGVDTNVFNSAGEQEADFTFTVTPALETWLPIARRALVKASTASDVVYYQTYTTERSVNADLAVRGELYLHRLTLFAETAYLNSRQRPNFEIDLRARRVERDHEAGAELRVTPKFFLGGAARLARVEFDADAFFEGSFLEQALNRETRAARGHLRYAATPLTSFVLRVEAAEDRFEHAAVRDSDSLRVMSGVEFKPRALISGSAYVGHRRFEPLDPRMPPFSGTVASAGLALRMLDATRVAFTADRDLAYSFEPLQPWYLRNGYGVGVTRRLARRFDVSAGAQRHRYHYRDLASEVDPDADPVQRVDTTRNYSASIGFWIARDVRFGVGAAWWERESNTRTARNYDGLRVGTSVTYGF